MTTLKLGTILMLGLITLTGCSTTSTKPVSSSASVEDKKLANLNSSQRDMLTAIAVNLRGIDERSGSGQMIAKAQDSEVCWMYNHYVEYAKLLKQYETAYIGQTELGDLLGKETGEWGQKTASAAYDRMKSGKLFRCDGLQGEVLTFSERAATEKFIALMGKYPVAATKFDDKEIRAGYLRALRADAKENIERAQSPGEGNGNLGDLATLVSEAKTKWHFTEADLGIPAAIVQKLSRM